MGWKTDLIVVEGNGTNREVLLEAIDRRSYSVHGRGTCDDMFPPRSLVIGEYAGCTLIADPKLPTRIIGQPAGPDAIRLTTTFSSQRLLCCSLHSVVNLAAFALYEKGQLKRCFGAAADDGVFANTGDVLDAERKVIGQYTPSVGSSGETVYLDEEGEVYTLDALGEDIVFEVISMMTGKRPDHDELLFDTPADIYSKPSFLKLLFRRKGTA